MNELTREQKIQIVNNRRYNVSRNIFEFELDIIVMGAQGRTEDAEVMKGKIEELKNADLLLQQFIESL